MKILDRYILKAHAGPFFFAFFTIMFVFILSFLAPLVDRLIGKGLNFFVLAEMVLLQSAWMVGLAVPMAVLVSTVMAFGTMTNDSELTVMRSGGISMSRLIIPVLCISFVLSIMVERFNNVLLPEANYRAKALLADITRAKPGIGIDQNLFSNAIQGYSILARKVDSKTGELTDIVLYDRERPDLRTVITAEKAHIAFTPDYRYLVMTLDNGQLHELVLPGMKKYRRMVFARHRYVFEATGYGFARTDEKNSARSDRDLTAAELLARSEEFKSRIDASGRAINSGLTGLKNEIDDIRRRGSSVGRDAAPVRSDELVQGRAGAIVVADSLIGRVSTGIDELEQYKEHYNDAQIEYHKKYSLAFACLVFATIGAPLGVMARRGGFGVGAGFSLLFFVLYWALMIGGQKIAERGLLYPVISVWLPNAILSAVGLFMLYRLMHSAGGSSR